MRRDRGADIWPGAVHDVEDSAGQPRFATNFAQEVRRHWCQLARLGHCGVAARDRWRDFPTEQVEREIPRRNQSSDAAWLTQRVVERDSVGDMGFGLGVQDRGGEEPEIARGARNI